MTLSKKQFVNISVIIAYDNKSNYLEIIIICISMFNTLLSLCVISSIILFTNIGTKVETINSGFKKKVVHFNYLKDNSWYWMLESMFYGSKCTG